MHNCVSHFFLPPGLLNQPIVYFVYSTRLKVYDFKLYVITPNQHRLKNETTFHGTQTCRKTRGRNIYFKN